MAYFWKSSATVIRLLVPRNPVCSPTCVCHRLTSTTTTSSQQAAPPEVKGDLPARVDKAGAGVGGEVQTLAEYDDVPVPPPKKYCSDGVKGLMEFFDQREKWGASEVKVGRSWRKPELRLKSNVDLHKLWYVLLKEKNMLLTTERECNEEARIFANPERIDKVEESMKSVEDVIRERNRAYFELETGESGEQPGKWALAWTGVPTYWKKREHLVPHQLNDEFARMNFYRYRLDDGFRQTDRDVKHFLALLNEKRVRQTAYWRRIEYLTAIATVKKFPNVDPDALQREFPLISVEKLYKSHHLRDLNAWKELAADKESVG